MKNKANVISISFAAVASLPVCQFASLLGQIRSRFPNLCQNAASISTIEAKSCRLPLIARDPSPFQGSEPCQNPDHSAQFSNRERAIQHDEVPVGRFSPRSGLEHLGGRKSAATLQKIMLTTWITVKQPIMFNSGCAAAGDQKQRDRICNPRAAATARVNLCYHVGTRRRPGRRGKTSAFMVWGLLSWITQAPVGIRLFLAPVCAELCGVR